MKSSYLWPRILGAIPNYKTANTIGRYEIPKKSKRSYTIRENMKNRQIQSSYREDNSTRLGISKEYSTNDIQNKDGKQECIF